MDWDKKVNAYFTPEPLPVEYRRYADPSTICHGKIVGDCLKGDLTSEREVLVLGDSHAAMLNHFFDYLGKELGFKARIITASSCVTIPYFDYKRIPEWAQEPCIKQIQASGQHIQDSDIIIVAGMWSYHTLSEEFNMYLREFVQSNQDKEIIFFLQIPKLVKEPDRVKRFLSVGLLGDQKLDGNWIIGNDRLLKMLKDYSNVIVVDYSGIPLFDSVPVYDGEIIYLDSHHLNEVGAKLYARATFKSFSDLMAKND